MAAARTRRWGTGTSAIVRALVAADTPMTQVDLAALVGVSQPRVSQVLAQLSTASAVAAQPDGYVGHRQRLIELYIDRHKPAFLDAEAAWYGLAPMSEQVQQVCAVAAADRARIAFSADFAPDLLAPWRHPTIAVVYTDSALDLTSAGLVPAESRADATIIIRHTSDTTLLSPFEPWPSRVAGTPLTDPVQQVWDLHDLGGADRVEAADRLTVEVIERSIGLPA